MTSLCDACKKPLDMERRIWTDGMFYMHPECVKSTPADDIVGLSKALVREARAYTQTRTAHDRHRVEKTIGFIEQDLARLRKHLDDSKSTEDV